MNDIPNRARMVELLNETRPPACTLFTDDVKGNERDVELTETAMLAGVDVEVDWKVPKDVNGVEALAEVLKL